MTITAEHEQAAIAAPSPALAAQRLARVDDVPRIEELMRSSILDLFPRYYDERQTASAAIHVGQPDLAMIEDGTCFVHEIDGAIVASGGWSRRDKLYTGGAEQAGAGGARRLDPRSEPARVRAMFVRSDWTRRGLGRAILESSERAARAEGFKHLALMATLPGEPLYRAFGFRELQRLTLPMPDGVWLECVAMERPIVPARVTALHPLGHQARARMRQMLASDAPGQQRPQSSNRPEEP